MGKKIICLVLIFLFFLCGCGQNQSSEAMDRLKESSEYYKSFESVSYDIKMDLCIGSKDMFTLDFELIKMETEAETDVFNAPYRYKNDSKSKYTVITGKEDESTFQGEMEVVQYGEKDGEKFTIYEINAGQWYRVPLNYEDYLKSDTMGINYIINYDYYIDNGQMAEDETIDGTECRKAVYNLKDEYALELFSQYGYGDFAGGETSEGYKEKALEIMEGTSLEVWYNKNDSSIVKYVLNLTPLLKNLKEPAAEYGKKYDEKEAEEIINNAIESEKIETVVYIKSVDSGEDFAVPEEALTAPGI